MTRAKAIIITTMTALMEAVIIAGAYRIEDKAFYALAALLAVYGFVSENIDFFHWLQKEEPDPKHLDEPESIWEYDDETADYTRLFETAEGGEEDGRTEA